MQKLGEICSNINISDTNQITFKGKSIFDELTLVDYKKVFRNNIILRLQGIIYEEFYTSKTITASNSYSETLLAENLKKYRRPSIQWSRNWLVEHTNDDGSLIACLKNQRRFLSSGEYIFIQEKKVNIRHYSELLDQQKGIYYFSGKTINNSFEEHIIRFYFNLKIDGILIWKSLIKQLLNTSGIAFQGKFFTKATDINRADNTVLYLDKSYFFNFKSILGEITQQIKPYLNPQTPLFTLKLHDGIGFAENPSNPNESFGMSRCRLIAEGIWQAHENKLPKSEWVNFVINYIKNQGYELDKFYLNPNSRFPYDFS